MTLWRRAKVAERILPLPDKDGKDKERLKRGRGFSNETQTESFILFAGAVIELQNTKGYCKYEDVFNGVRQGRAGFRYYKVPDTLYKKLAESNFPPQLLAVVVSDLIPLNLITRGGRHTSNKKDLPAKVKNLTWRQIVENERDHAAGRPIQKFRRLNSADDIVTADSTCEINFAEMDERLGFRDPNETLQSQSARRLLPLPNNKEKKTPVHRIVFHGNETISCRMACYWRNDCRKEYNRCRKFVESLLIKPAPLAPYSDSLPPTLAPLVNEKINQYWKKRRAARLASKTN